MLKKLKNVLNNYYNVEECESFTFVNGVTLYDCITVSNIINYAVITYDKEIGYIGIWDKEGLLSYMILKGTHNTMFFELGMNLKQYFSLS